MKNFLSITVILAAVYLQGADYVKLDQEAGQAVRAKDHALAEVKFGEAMKAARNPAEKCKAVRGKFDAMQYWISPYVMPHMQNVAYAGEMRRLLPDRVKVS